MRIEIKVIPNSSRDEIIKKGDLLVVKVVDSPEKNKANKKVLKLLSEYFKKEKKKEKKILIISGAKSRRKIVEVY